MSTESAILIIDVLSMLSIIVRICAICCVVLLTYLLIVWINSGKRDGKTNRIIAIAALVSIALTFAIPSKPAMYAAYTASQMRKKGIDPNTAIKFLEHSEDDNR